MTTEYIADQEFDFIESSDTSYSENQLKNGWVYYTTKFFISNRGKIWEDVIAEKQIDYLHYTGRSKSIPFSFCLTVFKNKTIYNDFLATLPANTRSIFETLIWKQYIDDATIKQEYNIDITKLNWRDFSNNKEFALFIARSFSGSTIVGTTIRLFLPESIRTLLKKYYPIPLEYKLSPVPTVPIGEDILMFNCEETIFNEMPLLLNYFSKKEFKYAKNGEISSSELTKLHSELKIKEFFSNDKFSFVRCMLIAGVFNKYKIPAKAMNIEDTIINIINTKFLKSETSRFILNFAKGLNYYNSYDYNVNNNNYIYKIFRQVPSNHWITFENAKKFCEASGYEFLPISKQYMINNIYFHYLSKDNEYKRYVQLSNINQFVTFPMLAGSVFLFASLGLMEICYKAKFPEGSFGIDWFSEYDGLIAFRLTNLGEYVLDLTKKYTPPVSKSIDNLELDESSLLIRAKNSIELAEIQLAPFATKISGNKFKFNSGLFLRNCNTIKEVSYKIGVFKHVAGDKLPVFWKKFLNDMIKNSKAITRETEMKVYNIPHNNIEFQHLLIKDNILNKLIIKADQFRILILSKNETVFKARLKELGIFLE